MSAEEKQARNDWRAVVAALANTDARKAWAWLVVGSDAPATGLSPAREARAFDLLRSAGLVRLVDGSPEPDEAVFRLLLAAAADAQPRPAGVQRFLRADGRIDRYPSSATDRRELLAHIAHSVVQADETVSEPELTERLARFSDDPVALRRYLVDADLLARTPSGSEYRLHGAD